MKKKPTPASTPPVSGLAALVSDRPPREEREMHDPLLPISNTQLPAIGWREWIKLPDLGISQIKAKIDTGARTSALHAVNIQYINRNGRTWVCFEVHPLQRNRKKLVHCEAQLVEERYITDSGGKRTLRPVIETVIVMHQRRILVEVTLVPRDEMGFRMLIGRQAIRGRYLVHAGRSYLGGRPKKKKKKSLLVKKPLPIKESLSNKPKRAKA